MQTATGDRRRGDRVQHGDRRREDKDRVALTLAVRLVEQLRDLSFGDATRQLDEEAA